ncbi:MAG: Tim44 domain-containing protein [Solirubrobacterales bacterium]|nr:Tim44 domain-containing protein [Solirubrobacterales bacterium]
MTRRRAAIVLLAALALALILAPAALAAAGGGSAGFGGGFHGGGGGGRGAGLYILIQILIRIAIFGHGLGLLIILGVVLLAVLYAKVAPAAQRWRQAQEQAGRAARRQVAHRSRRVELAAAEAAEDDPAFAPENVRAAAERLFTDVQAAWDAENRTRLRGLVAPALLEEWERRLDDYQRKGWRNRVQPLGPPAVEYVGLTHRGDPEQDRVVVRIEARLRDYVEDQLGNRIKRVGRLGEEVRVREFWTLGKRAGRWILLSIEQGAEGKHALEEQIVATPWSDERALRDEALVERAVADAVPEGTRVAEVADLQFDGSARAAALDLSLADGRFAPDVLEVAARRAVAAWAEAVDGDDSPLLAIATPGAARELLHPGDPSAQTRLVVRGPVIKEIRIAALDAAAQPPAMTIEVELAGRRYLEDRNTAAVVSGSQSRTTSFTEHWTLTLDGDPAQPWRIASVRSPVGRLA